MDPIQRIRETNARLADEARVAQRHEESQQALIGVQETVVKSFKSFVDYLDNHVSKTQVINQLKEIGTPDALKVVEAVDQLHETLKTHENTDLSGITEVMNKVLDEAKKLPKELPKFDIPQPIDNTKQFQSLEKAIKAVEKVVKEQKLIAEAPIVNIPTPNVNVEATDLSPLEKGYKEVVKAIKGIVIPEFKTDNKEVEKLLKKQNKILEEILDKPVGGGGGGGSSWAAVNSAGIPLPLNLNAEGELLTNGLTDAELRASPVPVVLNGTVSTGNSTTTPLAEGATFTGAWEEVEDYANIRIVGESDVSSATNGAIVEWSNDGSNVVRQSFATITAPNYGIYYNTPPQAKYFRIRVTNGASPQTYFVLQTTYSYAPESPVQQLLGAGITDNNLGGLTKAILWGKKPDGTYTALGAPDISTSGSVAALNDAVTLDLAGQSSAAVQITGTWTATLSYEATVDDTNWFSINGVTPGNGYLNTTTTMNGAYRINCAGLSKIRVRCSSHTTGTASISIAASTASGVTSLSTPMPVDTYSATASSTSSVGDTTLVTIGAAERLRLHYISLNADGANAGDVTVTVKIGSSSIYKVCLKKGSTFARNLSAGRRYLSGNAGDDLTITLSAAYTVNYSVEYEIITV